MNKLKKQLPILLYTVLLIIIAVLCIIIANTSDAHADDSVDAPIIIDKDNMDNTSSIIDNPADKLPEENSPPILYSDSVPRVAYKDEMYLYSQKIYGDGTITLCDVLQTSVGIYTIVTTDCINGDICGKNKCLGLVKLDSYGNLLKTLPLDYSYAANYITACQSALGLIVVTAPVDLSYYYIFIISYDLDETKSYRISSAKGGKVIPTMDSFLFFAEYPEESVLYSFTGNGFTFQSVGSGTLIKTLEYGTYYTLIYSDLSTNSYSIVKLSKSGLNVLSETKCNDSTVIDVFPVSDTSNKQEMLVIENRNGVIWAKKFTDNSFSDISATKKLGKFDVYGAYFDGENILLVCNGNLNGIITLTPALHTDYNENKTDYIPKGILDGIYSNGTLYYLACDSADSPALIYIKNDLFNIKHFNVTTSKARFLINLDGTFTLLYQQDNQIQILGIKE